MPIKRFIFFWLTDYLAASLVVYTLSAASVSIFGLPQLGYIALLFIPISTLFFSWMFYRPLGQLEAHRLLVAAAWVALAMVVDALIGWLVAQTPPLNVVTSPILLAVYGSKFLAVFVGAYLGVGLRNPVSVAVDTLSPR